MKIRMSVNAKTEYGWYNMDMSFKAKKGLFIVLFLLIISLLFCLDLFLSPGQAASFDGPTHLTNIAQFYQAMKDGDWLPRWADGFANYGMPIPIIAQQTTSYLGALINFAFRNIIFSYNIVVFIGSFLSVLFFYHFLRLHTSMRGALLGTFLFHLAPYRILNIYVRGAIPEFFAGVFFPLTLIALYWWIKEGKSKGLFLLEISIAGLLLTHPFTLVIYSFFFVPYLLYLLIDKKQLPVKKLGMLVIFGLLGIGLAAYYIVPLFLELKYFYYGSGNRFLPDQYLRLVNYVSPAWYYFYRDDIGTRGHFIIFGAIESFLLITASLVSVIQIIQKRKVELLPAITIVVGWMAVFMTSRFAVPIYEKISLLGKIQHPWRMMALFIYITPILIAIYARKWNVWIIGILMLAIAVVRFPQLYGKNYLTVSDKSYFFTLENLHGEIMNTIWTGKTEQYPVKQTKPGIISGTGKVLAAEIHNSWRKYSILADTEVRMADYTFYFPGWKVYVDGTPTTIEFQDMNYRGVITYNLPPGVHTVLVRFENTKIRLLGDIVSVLSVLSLGIIYMMEKRAGIMKKIISREA